jgi:hypothetical protein
MVDRADEEFKGEARERACYEGLGGRTDPVAFEANNDGDLGAVFLSQAEGFGEVGFFVGRVPGFCLASFDLGGVLEGIGISDRHGGHGTSSG